MKRKLTAMLCLAALLLCMTGCSEKEETTTLTGMVVSVEGTVVNIMDTSNMGNFQGNWGGNRPSGSENGQRPEGNFTIPEGEFTMPEGMTIPEGGFTRPEGGFVRPEGGNRPEGGTRPEGGNRPEGDYTRPQGEFDPNNFQGQFPEGNFTMPEGMTLPEGGNRPNFGGNNENGKLQMETTAVDLANAHISIQDGDIKAAGSISDIKVGSMLTITLNGKGVATEVLVTSSGMSGFAGNFGGFGGNFGGGKGQGNRKNTPAESNG